ncbi:MAG: peptidoglycan-binding domain-containing protein [Candidatus Taylorbacteria bacterium]
MKKLSVYSVIILVVIVSVFLTSGIVNAQATGSAIKYCPTGYICELIPVLPNCPVGYICKLAGGTPTTSITNTTNTNIGTPLPKPIRTCYAFSSNLEIGSVGADVVALQTWLISSGYSIPGISSGSVTKGTFDTETANAVSRYQLSMGFPTTRFFGPLTRQSINNTCNNTINTTTTNQVPSTNSIIVTNPSIDYKVPSRNSINVVTPKAGDSLIVNIPTQIVWTGNFEKGDELFEIQMEKIILLQFLLQMHHVLVEWG